MILPPGGSYLSSVDRDPPSSSLEDTHVTNTSTAESGPIIRSFIHSPSSVAVARSLRGEEAQEFIDIIDRVGIVQSQHGDTPLLGN